jgi:hypothetical protein
MERIIKTPKVTLLSHTAFPLETVYSVWEASKGEGKLLSPAEVRMTVKPEEVRKLFRSVIAQKIPIGEHIDFVFMLENISISWREQAVRHRIGTKASPERLGADIVPMDVDSIPDLADSSWWSQSMRIQDMGTFASSKSYRVPQTILDHPDSPRFLALFDRAMLVIQDTYNTLVEAGIPMEDAREVMPLGAQHRMSWKLNIGSLQHIVGKRGCWILQHGIWGPVIEGMISELVAKIDPIFGELVTPPCLKGDDYNGCVYIEENRRRYDGSDKLPPCPLHFAHEKLSEFTDGGQYDLITPPEDAALHAKLKVPMAEEMRARAKDYEKFWGRNPWSGKRLRVLP